MCRQQSALLEGLIHERWAGLFEEDRDPKTRDYVRESGRVSMVLTTIALALLILVFTQGVAAQNRLGSYFCKVEKIHGDDEIGKLWLHGRLIYNADEGTLDGTFDPWDDLEKKGMLDQPRRLFSRLPVATGPWDDNHLTAVQLDPADPPNVRPIIAWLQIQTLGNPTTPSFQFFSNTIRVIAQGECMHIPR